MSSRSRQLQLAEEEQSAPRPPQGNVNPQVANTNQASPIGTNLPNSNQDVNSLNRKDSVITGARYDQPALVPSTSGASSNLRRSHGRTTVYSGHSYNDSQNAEGYRSRRARSDMASVYSYNSARDAQEFVKQMHGRIFNRMNDAYWLPTDDEEWNRLDKQHSVVTIAVGGLYPCREAVEAILSSEDGVEKKILDLGCGTGSWAIEMANRFPHCEVIGVDVAPTPLDMSAFPPNLSFEIDDINLGLVHFRDSFDMVHMRCVMGGIKDLRKTLEEAQACLKPGGIFVVIDGDFRMYKDTNTIYPLAKLPEDENVSGVSEDGSWMARVMWEGCEASKLTGPNMDAGKDVMGRGLWDYPLIDPETAMGGHFFCPLGSWATADTPNQTQTLQYVGILMRQNFLSIHRAYHSILLKHGMQQHVVDEWGRKVDEELGKAKLHVWARFMFACARRRASPNQPAPTLPAPTTSPSQPLIDSSQSPFATYEEWYTEERAREERERRMRTSGDPPRAAVRIAYANLNQSTQS